MTSARSDSLPSTAHEIFRDWELLWVGGLAVLLVVVIQRWSRLEGEAREWAQYLTLGTIFPATLLILSLCPRRGRSAARVALWAKIVLAAVGIFISTRFFIQSTTFFVLSLALIQVLLAVGLSRGPQSEAPDHRHAAMLSSAPSSLFVAIASWASAVALEYWTPFGNGVRGSWYTLAVFLLAFALVLLHLFHERRSPEQPTAGLRWAGRVGSLGAIALIGLVSLRSQWLFVPAVFYHWGVFIGPAELVRHGGWLLWDVPSQYGLLSILTLAALPTRTTWQALYLADAAVLALSASFLFFLLRSTRAGLVSYLCSLAVTLGAVFLLPGEAPMLAGPQITPAAAAYRFFWCYALLAILVWDFLGDPARRSSPWVLWIGCVSWLLGTLWSCESAFYCAATWLPAYALVVFRRSFTVENRRQAAVRAGVAWLSLPAALLLSVLGLLRAYYVLRLGHAPDWQAFYEYTLSFKAGFGALPIEPFGPVWVLFLVFCAVSTAAVGFLRQGLRHRALPLATGAFGCLWATSSYFVGRSHPLNALDLAPIFVTVIAVTLLLLAREGSHGRCATLLRLSFVPVLTVLLTATFGNGTAFPGLPAALLSNNYKAEIENGLPEMEPSLASLMIQAHVKPGDPVVYYHWDLLPARPVRDPKGHHLAPSTRAWLPVTPFTSLPPLPRERTEVYIARFVRQVRMSGWLVEPKKYMDSRLPVRDSDFGRSWLSDQLRPTHLATRVFENDDYKLTWFEFNPAPGR